MSGLVCALLMMLVLPKNGVTWTEITSSLALNRNRKQRIYEALYKFLFAKLMNLRRESWHFMTTTYLVASLPLAPAPWHGRGFLEKRARKTRIINP